MDKDTELEYYNLLNIPKEKINKMDLKQVRSLTSRYQKLAQKIKKDQIEEITKKHLPLPNIYRDYNNEKDVNGLGRLDFRLSQKNLSTLKNNSQKRNYLLSELYRARTFLESETSTLEGWENTVRRFIDTIERKTGADFHFIRMSKKKSLYKKMFEVYNKIDDVDVRWKMLDSAQAFKTIAEYIKKHPTQRVETIIKNLASTAEDIYVKSKEKQSKKIPTDSISFDSDKV